MTSGVKQALPQILMQKAGVDGKAARNRAPLADFAEALGMGKHSGKVKTVDAKADLPQTDARPPWPRLASKLDETIDRTQEIAPRLEAEIDQPKDASKDEASDTKPEARSEPTSAKDSVLPNVLRSAADPAEALVQMPAPTPKWDEADTPTDASAHPPKEPVVHAEQDIVIDKPLSATTSAEPASEKSFVPMVRNEQVEPIRFEPAARGVAPTEQPDQAKEALPDAPVEPAKAPPRITVVAQQNIPAPMPSTALVLVESIAASDLLDPANARLSLDAIHASATHASAQSLKIQLHPAELGMVTATLRFAGEQLSIELQVENHEAYRRLASDSETIVGSLRDLGYDVERVTVLQPSIAATSSARSDASTSMPSPQGRSAEQFGSGTASGGGGNAGGRSAEGDGNQGRGDQHHPTQRAENPGGGLFI